MDQIVPNFINAIWVFLGDPENFCTYFRYFCYVENNICIKIRSQCKPKLYYIFTVPSSLIHRNSICILFWQLVCLDYGMKTKNPIDNVRFYNKDDVTKAVGLNRPDVCIILRIFVTWPVIIIHAFKKSYPRQRLICAIAFHYIVKYILMLIL